MALRAPLPTTRKGCQFSTSRRKWEAGDVPFFARGLIEDAYITHKSGHAANSSAMHYPMSFHITVLAKSCAAAIFRVPA